MTIIENVPRDASPAFIGRQAEIEQLEAAWERVAHGEPQLVLVGGDAGIGKTRLLREYLARPVGGRVTAIGGCVPVAGGSLPYTPFAELLRTLAMRVEAGYDPRRTLSSLAPASRAELGRLVPALQSADSSPAEADDTLAHARLFVAVRTFLAGVAAQAPALLVVEDLHWADGSSLDLLAYLIRNLGSEPILVIASYRTDELHRRHPLRPWIAETGRLGRVERLQLGRLERAELRDEVAELLGNGADPSLVDRIVERSEGNPLFVTELVASAQRGGDPRALPETLRDGFIDRLERLGPDARAVVRSAAAIGRPASEPLLGAAADLPADRLGAALHEAIDTQVLAASPDAAGGFEPRHALLGEAILDDLLPVERSAVHRRLAALLESGADDGGSGEPARIAAEIAHHRWEARDFEQAIAASVRAAIAASEARAYAEADGQWTRALEAWPGDGTAVVAGVDQAEAFIRAADVAATLGDSRRAGNLAALALTRIDARAEPIRAAGVHRRMIWYLVHLDWRSAVIHSGQAVRLIPPGDPPPEAARILADRAILMALRQHTDRAEPMARHALRLAERHHRPDAELQALKALADCLASRSEHAAAIEVLTRAYDLAQRLGVAEGLVNTGQALGWCLNDAGLWEAAIEHCDRVEGRIRELGLELRYGTAVVSHRGWALLNLGRWAELEILREKSLGVDRQDAAFRPGFLRNHALMRVRQRRLDEARRLASVIGAVGEVPYIEPLDGALDVWCEIALAEGDWVRAREIVEIAFALMPIAVRPWQSELRPYVLLGLQAEAELAFEARIRRDAEAEAEAVRIARDLAGWARRLADRVTAAGEPLRATTLADAALAEALLSRVEHRSDPEAWRRALGRYEALGAPYAIARIRHWLTEAILDAGGSRSAAAAELAPAARIAADLGATALEAKILDLARRARLELGTTDGAASADGGDRPPALADRPAGDRLTELVDLLTPREREVLGYVAAGWTNRRIAEALFISGSTVGVHVSNLMGKLGAANRAEAALIGDRLGLLAPMDQP